MRNFLPFLIVLFCSSLFAQDADPKRMMTDWLQSEIDDAGKIWQERYDKLKTVDDVEKYAAERREFLLRQLGRTWDRNAPLNAKVSKTFQKGTPGKDAYRVEMVLFESVPGFYVTAAVFIPDETRFKAPYPAILVPCGHTHIGKAGDIYQQAPALAATHGLLAMVFDPIDQGERSQRLDENGKPKAQGVAAHNVLGAGSILLGRNAATFEYWDLVRGLDYLQSRKDVIPDKLGVFGISGGGTQTSYIMAVDDRVAVAAPSCYLCGLYDSMIPRIGPQDAEQNIFGQLAFGMDHVDYCIMRAPRPTLLLTTTEDFFPVEDAWKTFRNAKRIYDRFGYAEKMAIMEHDAKHTWAKNLREASVRWVLRWLAGRDERIVEADDMPIFKPEEFLVTEKGEVLTIDGARSAYDLNRDYNEELLAARKAKNDWEGKGRDRNEFVATIRKTIGARPLAEIPKYDVEPKGDNAFVLKTENGKILLSALRSFSDGRSSGESNGTIIYLHDNGKSADPARITELVRTGKTVVAVDLRGLGETQAVCKPYYKHEQFGTDGTDYFMAYLLGKSYVGMRAEDLLAAARWISEGNNGQKIDLVASGEVTGTVALHAAALEPALFSSVKLDRPVRSWYDVVKAGDAPYPITNLVHGALLEYDIPDLVRLSEAKIASAPIRLFNGRNLDGWYTFLSEKGKNNDPDKVFSVKDGVIHILGEEFGCITTEEEYGNYVLDVEFKAGEKTLGRRKDKAFDSGVLIHSIGNDGSFGKAWMDSIEVNVIDGGCGDILVVVNRGKDAGFSITTTVSPVTPDSKRTDMNYDPNGETVTVTDISRRINRIGRDPEWKDVARFRGPNEIERPPGQWNFMRIVAAGDTIDVYLNGKHVNRATQVKPVKGRIQIQAEGAEYFYRRVDLMPL